MCHSDRSAARNGPVIVWFRDDLRASDHPALAAAATSGRPSVCVYVPDEARGGPAGQGRRGAGRTFPKPIIAHDPAFATLIALAKVKSGNY